MRFVSKLLCFVVFAIIAALAATPLAAALGPENGSSNYVFLAVAAVIALASFTAPTGRRAWGRASLLTGLLFVAMPLSMTALSGRVAAETTDPNSVAEVAGATLAAGVMVGASMFVGFILGAIFVILGLVLVLGGRREVVVVERAAAR